MINENIEIAKQLEYIKDSWESLKELSPSKYLIVSFLNDLLDYEELECLYEFIKAEKAERTKSIYEGAKQFDNYFSNRPTINKCIPNNGYIEE